MLIQIKSFPSCKGPRDSTTLLYVCQGRYVMPGVCLFVCLFVWERLQSWYIALNCYLLTVLILKMSHTCTYRLALLAVTRDQYHVRVQRVCRLQLVILHCILRYISCVNAGHWPCPVQKMFRDQTEVTLDRSGPVLGRGLVLTLAGCYYAHP